MHFALLVVTPTVEGTDYAAKAAELLAPYNENLEVEPYEGVCGYCEEDDNCDHCGDTRRSTRTNNPRGQWDWYHVGGRFSGIFSDYEPAQDARNFEVCEYCVQHPGQRNWGGVLKPCNACCTMSGGDGEGRSRKWFNEPNNAANIAPVATILADYPGECTHALLLPGSAGTVWVDRRDDEDGSDWDHRWRSMVSDYAKGHTGVVIDCHS